MRVRKLLATVAVGAIGVVGVGLINPAVALASCGQANPWFPAGGGYQQSPSTVTKQAGTCADFNLGPTDTGYDYFQGYYYGNGVWKTGAAGWVMVSINTEVLVSNVAATTPLKAQAWFGNVSALELY